MASLFKSFPPATRLLDAGAGIGSLATAAVTEILDRTKHTTSLSITAYEIDKHIGKYLEHTLQLCVNRCTAAGIRCYADIHHEDFIADAVKQLGNGLFSSSKASYTHAILNPPYKKINSDSEHRFLMREVGVETSNLYTAFLALSIKLLASGGELVAITPRSFCNGPYFRPFRELFLREMAVQRVHVFESRSRAFAEDEVLQENVIFHAIKSPKRPGKVLISSSLGPDETATIREVPMDEFVRPDDPDRFIHIVVDEFNRRVAAKIRKFTHSLTDIGLSVSTGRVVDFRATSFLRKDSISNTVPLIYPCHFADGWISWPKLGGKKPNAIMATPESADLLVPAGVHVLVKRFSAKEEKRRIVAAVYDPARVPATHVGFENHLNYFHENGAELQLPLAVGLAAFLNSSLVDVFFRQFNGHTQVNATDLRSLKYPSREKLMELGRIIGGTFPSQVELDQLIERRMLGNG
ncbi:MAG: Eco57I restriction-modification methylase domain-containing protein [Phycisphaerales bacterium]|nr:Eco57I restriction-modification methylase domain-containing protein [Phycisphaerales bacterium]